MFYRNLFSYKILLGFLQAFDSQDSYKIFRTFETLLPGSSQSSKLIRDSKSAAFLDVFFNINLKFSLCLILFSA